MYGIYHTYTIYNIYRGSRCSPQEPAAVQGRRKGLDCGGRGLDGVSIGIGVAGGNGFGYGCSLGFLEDVLVESGERVVEFCQKRVSALI